MSEKFINDGLECLSYQILRKAQIQMHVTIEHLP